MNPCPIDHEELKVLYAQGHEPPWLGTHFKCHQDTIRKRLKKLGVKLRVTLRERARDKLHVGQEFGRLTVESWHSGTRGKASGKRVFVRCLCACGKTVEVYAGNLLRNGNTSCGCRVKLGPDGPNWKGCGQLSGYAWAQIRVSAISRRDPAKRVFEITIQEAWEMFVAQGGLCALSGIPISFAKTGESQRQGKRTASLDRIDSAKGYTIDNVQWLHKDVNCIKTDMPQERFIELCRLIAARHLDALTLARPASWRYGA